MNEIVKGYFRKEVLIEACGFYGIDASEVKLIRGNSNLIYDCGGKILRLSHSDIRNISDVEVEVDWLTFLSNKELPVVEIVSSRNNRKLEKIGNDKHFTVVCFEKIVGKKVTEADWNEGHFQKLGKILGRLHSVGKKYGNSDYARYKSWNEIVEFENYELLSSINPSYLEIHEALIEEFKSYPESEENYGIIHYDIHHGNYLLTKKSNDLVLFDFEMICKSWYVNDIAAVVYYAKHFPSVRDEENFEERFLTSFWNGYEEEGKLAEIEKQKIPKFLLYRDLLVLGFLRKIWDFDNLLPHERVYVEMIEKSITKRKSVL